ncbi:isocitrate/isopropylmalate family dehydrogenase (plasmid) [Paracoccus marcusii]|uniref:isocitrate/isopropylmalate family dehydrogenase n=1 Tax=Paracoccus marcusii TaxID=59779 RepID=UPI002ED1B515|nr:isocitrate/isopropylmalate family dehydrogenase [Paracoccus marcusii]
MPEAQGGVNPSGHLRKHLDLFANIRPARSHPDFPARCGVPVDLVIVRENTEGFTPTARCSPAPESSCRPRMWPSPCAR